VGKINKRGILTMCGLIFIVLYILYGDDSPSADNYMDTSKARKCLEINSGILARDNSTVSSVDFLSNRQISYLKQYPNKYKEFRECMITKKDRWYLYLKEKEN
jgi:hypothetical protein